jgi:hypothetical protein
MIPVTAKFRVQRKESSMQSCRVQDENGEWTWKPMEVQTIVLNPITSNDPNSENGKFFASTPSGEIRLGTINAEAAAQFALDGEMYVTFTPAEIGTFQPAS